MGRPQKAYDLLWPARHLHAQLTPLQFRAIVTEECDASSLSNNKSNDSKSNGKKGSKKTSVGRLIAAGGSAGTYEDLRDYARRLVASFRVPDEAGGGGKEAVSPIGSEADLEEQDRVGVEVEEEEGGLTGCREAVEILTRNPKKGVLVPFSSVKNLFYIRSVVSYDVNKDGVKVAVLTFTKSAYRLGETVVGVVELNDRGSRARVLSVCFFG